MLVAELVERGDELRRHRDEAALALHRLEDDAGDVLRVDVLLEQQLEPVQRVLGRDAAVRVRRRRAVDVGRQRPEALLVDELRRHRHRQVRPAVEGAVEDDDSGALRRGARDLHGVLDRLGAGVDEQRLRRGVAGPEVVEPARDLDVRLVDPDHEALVQELVGLLVDRAHDAGRAVAEVLAGDAASEVEVLAPVDVPDLRAPRFRDDEIGRGDAARDISLPRLEHPLRPRPLLHRHTRIDYSCSRSLFSTPVAHALRGERGVALS